MTGYLVGFFGMQAFLLLRIPVDMLARARGWRVGGWGRLLCWFHRTGGVCLKCETDFRYVNPHDTPYRAESGLCCFPLCEGCWSELDEDTRLPYYARMLREWAERGKYEGDEDGWTDDEFAIYAAVKAGL